LNNDRRPHDAYDADHHLNGDDAEFRQWDVNTPTGGVWRTPHYSGPFNRTKRA